MKKIRRNQSMTLRVLIVYTALLFVILAVVVGWSSVQYARAMKAENEKNSKWQLERAKQDIVMYLDSVDTEAIKLLNSSEIASLIRGDFQDQVDERYAKYLAIKQISSIRRNMLGIRAVYFVPGGERPHYVLGDKMEYEWENFPYGEEAKLALARKEKSVIFSNRAEHDVVLLHAYPVNASKESIEGYVQFHIDADYLYRRFASGFSPSSEVLIADDSGRIVTGRNREKIGEDWKTVYGLKDTLPAQHRMDNRAFLLFTDQAELSDWQYIAFMDINEIAATIRKTTGVIILIGVLAFLLGTILLFWAGKFAFKPIDAFVQSMTEKIRSTNKEFLFQGKNDLNSLESILGEIIGETKILKEVVNSSLPARKWELLISLLAGKISERKKLAAEYAALGMEYRDGGFYVLAVEYASDTLEQIELAGGWMARRLEECCGALAAVDMENRLIAIAEGGSGADSIKLIRESAAQCVFEAKEAMGVEAVVGIGRFVREPGDIQKSYREAIECLNYKLVEEKDSILLYQEISRCDTDDFYRLLSRTVKIQEVLPGGSRQELQRFIGAVFDSMTLKRFSVEQMRLILSKLLFEAKSSLEIQEDSRLSALETRIEYLSVGSQLESVRRETERILGEMQQELNVRREKDRGGVVMERVLEYIHRHYSDPNLSITILSEKMKMSSTYIINGIKEQTGKSYYELLTEIRMEKAKDLLENTRDKVYKVAERVGYENSQSFIRAFKKYTGSTPEAYRKAKAVE